MKENDGVYCSRSKQPRKGKRANRSDRSPCVENVVHDPIDNSDRNITEDTKKYTLNLHINLTTLEDSVNNDKDDKTNSKSPKHRQKYVNGKNRKEISFLENGNNDIEGLSYNTQCTSPSSRHLTSIGEERISHNESKGNHDSVRAFNDDIECSPESNAKTEDESTDRYLTDNKSETVSTACKLYRSNSLTPKVRPKSSGVRSASICSSFDTVRPFSTMPRRRSTSRYDTRSKSLTDSSFTISKQDLEFYLPRRSCFNCHDKTLKDAGYEVEVVSGAQKRRKELLEILQKIRDDRNGTKIPAFGRPSANLIQTFDDTDVPDGQSMDESSNQNTQTQKGIPKRQVKSAKKKSEYDEEEVRVDDYQPLLLYLKYVKENPDDYLSHRSQNASSNLVEVRPGDSIIRMGSIYQRGQHGLPSDSVVVNAAHDIRQRFCDPGQWTTTSKEKTLLNLTSAKKESVFTQNKDSATLDSNTNTEESKSEYEIRKKKMEAWLKTISTAQLNKAKELALRDLGEEDRCLSKWWQALKSCHYIR